MNKYKDMTSEEIDKILDNMTAKEKREFLLKIIERLINGK